MRKVACNARLWVSQQTIEAPMKRFESSFEFAEHFFVLGVKKCVERLNILFGFKLKISVLAAILIPCLLQLPLIAFGKDRADGVDSRLVPLECTGECVDSVGAVGDGCNLWGKSGFENENSISSCQIPLQGEGTTNRNKRNQNGSENTSKFKKDFDHWWIGSLGGFHYCLAAQSLYSRLSDGSSFTFFSHDEFQESSTFSLTWVPMGMSGACWNEQAVTRI